MQSRNVLFTVLLACSMLGGLGQAAALPVAPGQILQVEFNFPADPTTTLGEIDVLQLGLVATCAGGAACGAPSASIALFDGSMLLGTNTLTFTQPGTSFAFTSPTSLYTFQAADVSDFSSIANGTLDGRLQITNLGTATFDFTVIPFPGGSVGRAGSTNGYVIGAPDPILTSQQVVAAVPEPATWLLIAAGLAALLGYTWLFGVAEAGALPRCIGGMGGQPGGYPRSHAE